MTRPTPTLSHRIPTMSNPPSEKQLSCRLCAHPQMEEVLDVSSQPPANSLRKPSEPPPPAIPLILCRCTACGTLQLSETVSPESLFSHYVWVTGTSAAAQGYAKEFAGHILKRAAHGKLKILEVASNDGTFLKSFLKLGHDVVGVDPAANIAAIANEAGVRTYPEFFGAKSAAKVIAAHGSFDVVFARNVIPHVKDANDVVAGMVAALGKGGLLAIEFHRADIILSELHYDSIYHEHLFYHSLASIEQLARTHGLHAFDVTSSPISGGSHVAYFALESRPPSDALQSARAHEERLGITGSAAWKRFAAECMAHRDALKAAFDSLAKTSAKIIGFGASARSSTLLNFANIDASALVCIADNNPLKAGRLTPGTNIPIKGSAEAFAEKPDAVLLLAWNFEEEIIHEIRSKHGWSGPVLVPLPGQPRLRRI